MQSAKLKIFMAMLTTIALSASLYAERGGLSPRSRHVLREMMSSNAERCASCFILLDDDDDLAELQRLGVEVQHKFGKVLTASVPLRRIGAVSELACVKQMQLAQKMSVCNDKAREMSMVNEAQGMRNQSSGTFSGKGVVVGMVDVGIDFNHIEFADADGKSRVRRVYLPAYEGGMRPVVAGYEMTGSAYSTPETIAQLTADCTYQSHGTHTTTIAAGGYKGNAYYGMAPESDLVLCAMPEKDLTDVNIANSVAYIFDYAESVSRPAVVNMSLASTMGPHDGTSMLSRAFSSMSGKGRVCVVASGNDARKLTKISKHFEAPTDTLRTFYENWYERYCINGDLDLWADDSTPFKARFVVYDISDGRAVYESEWYEANADADDLVELDVSTQTMLNKLCSGKVTFSSGIGSNGKMELYTTFDVKLVCDVSEASKYAMGVKVSANAGATITGWSNEGTQMVSYGIDGWMYGEREGNMSDLTTGDGVISVGAYCSKTSVETIGGHQEYNDCEVGDFMPFSSYGKDMNGISRPTVSAPGYVLVSAINRYDETQTAEHDKVLVQTIGGSRYCWGAMGGTSQSAPVVSGILALWLEACPTLDSDEIEDVLRQTSTRDENVLRGNAERWGCGKINALSGLQYISDAGVDNNVSDKLWLLQLQGNRFVANAPIDGDARLTVYDITGRMVTSAEGEVFGGYAEFECDQVPHCGVYVAWLQVGDASHCFKIVY